MSLIDNMLLCILLVLLVRLLVVLRRRRLELSDVSAATRTGDLQPIGLDVRVTVTPSDEMLRLLGEKPPVEECEPAPAAAAKPADVAGDGNPQPVTVQPARFLMDSLMLARSFRHVCPRQMRTRGQVNGFKERFHYATGLKLDEHTYVVTDIVPVRYSKQSPGGVLVEDGSNISALANLDRIGLPLLAHFHSHPGFGRGANRPSAVDRAFQERLERGGHVAVGFIFSRDGFLRAFAGDLDRFVVEVQGSNVKKVSDNEFKIDLDDPAL